MKKNHRHPHVVIIISLICVISLNANPTDRRERLWSAIVNKWDTNKDDMISQTEWKGQISFSNIDQNGDKQISKTEFIKFRLIENNPCPSNCTSDADCADCSDGRTKCVNGICVMPIDPCPSNCTSDTDCAGCPDGRTKCSNGDCVRPPDPCPDQCTGDEDCWKCQDGRTKCVNGECVRPPDPCPSGCTSDADCASCPDGRSKCVNGVCVQP